MEILDDKKSGKVFQYAANMFLAAAIAAGVSLFMYLAGHELAARLAEHLK